MWTRALIKSNAKLALKNFYWMGFVVNLVAMAIAGFATNAISQVMLGTVFMGVGGTAALLEEDSIAGALLIIFVYLLTLALVYLVEFFLVFPLTIGLYRFYLESRSFKSRFERVFCVFSSGGRNYMAVVKVMFLYTLKIFLWSLLFVVPGIIKAYEYRMVPFLLAENPYLPPKRIFELSSAMTNGEKGDMFILDLSFFGWTLLGTLLCGIGLLFVYPYIYATWAELYTALREKAFGLGITGTDELIGIYPPA